MKQKDRIKRIQTHVGAVSDGIIGPNTLGKIEVALRVGAIGNPESKPTPKPKPTPAPVSTKGIDDRSAKNIKTLHSAVRPVFEQLILAGKRIAKANGAGDYKMIGGTRTYAQQNALYAKGRSTGGRRVTNARGGYSNHNFGIAGDNGVFGKDGSYLDSSNPPLAAKIHKQVSDWAKQNFPEEIEWGGDWRSFKDTPHFQFRNGLSTFQMRSLVAAGKSVV